MDQLFSEGDKFVCKYSGKTGTVRNLRNDQYEKTQRLTNSYHYYYHVDFDDGSFETYQSQQSMIRSNEETLIKKSKT